MARPSPPITPMRPGRCSTTSAGACGIAISSNCSASPPRRSRMFGNRAATSGAPSPSISERSCRSAAWPVTNRRRCLARDAGSPARRRTPTAPVRFSCSTPGSRAHLVRAALEAMAFSTKDVLDAMLADATLKLSSLLVDGGAAANDWLMQFQADVLGVTVARPDLVETTALGAAGLAGLGAGLWKSADDFLAGRMFTRFHPSLQRRAVQARAGEWHRAVQTALHWAG